MRTYAADFRVALLLAARGCSASCEWTVSGLHSKQDFSTTRDPQRHNGVALATFKVGTAAASGEQEEAALQRLSWLTPRPCARSATLPPTEGASGSGPG
jgi:hypothetical protein